MHTPTVSTEQLSVELLDAEPDDVSLRVTNATVQPFYDDELRGVPAPDPEPVFVGSDAPDTPDSAAVSAQDYGLDEFLSAYGLDGHVTATHEEAETTLLDTRTGELHTDPVLWSLATEEVDEPIPGTGAPEPPQIEGMYSRQEEVYYRTKRRYEGPEIDVAGEHEDYLVPVVGAAMAADDVGSYTALVDAVTVTVPELRDDSYR